MQNKRNCILFIFGTRPEAIKMAPIIKEFQKFPSFFKVRICVTGQHREMLDQVLSFFGIRPDFDLNLMSSDQTLFDVTSKGIKLLEEVVDKCKPCNIFVQGDTTTAFIGGLAGYYKKISVSHIEAGLRTYNKYSPFPEEVNRKLIDHLSDYFFAATSQSIKNLKKEGIKNNVYLVGNTVIDALLLGLSLIKKTGEKEYFSYFNFIDFKKKIILVTAHRRESFGLPFKNICFALKELSKQFKDIEIIYPVHLNPNVAKPVYKILSGISNIKLITPLSYQKLIWLMDKSYLVLTDSGGIQEEAPSLGKPVLVLRDVTERPEGIKAGCAKLVGTRIDNILKEVRALLENQYVYRRMSSIKNPYGDGTASMRIVDIIRKHLPNSI